MEIAAPKSRPVGCVDGGAKVVEKWQFEIPEKSRHGFSVIGFRHLLPPSVEEGRRGFGWNLKKMEAEANGISNRRFSGSFVSPLTNGSRVIASYQLLPLDRPQPPRRQFN